MKLSIVDPEKIKIYHVSWVELNTHAGNMVIQENHAPMIVKLADNNELLFCLTTGEQESVQVAQAIAHVTRSEVKILTSIVV